MKIKIRRIMPSIILIIALLITFSFITGFNKVNGAAMGINPSYADNIGDSEDENAEYQDESTEDPLEGDDTDESEDMDTFICSKCGYVYDPVIGILDPDLNDGNNIYIAPGTKFEDLPADWACPICGAIKSDFEGDENLKNSDPQAWLAHLEHVLAMRSKHLVVLQRVIDAHLLKNPVHPSILSLYQAIQSSSKSVLKAQQVINDYKEYIANLNPGTGNDNGETLDSTPGTDEEIAGNSNGKENGNNKDNDNKKDNSDKGGGSSNGKNKNK
jgi:rubredoxin